MVDNGFRTDICSWKRVCVASCALRHGVGTWLSAGVSECSRRDSPAPPAQKEDIQKANPGKNKSYKGDRREGAAERRQRERVMEGNDAEARVRVRGSE